MRLVLAVSTQASSSATALLRRVPLFMSLVAFDILVSQRFGNTTCAHAYWLDVTLGRVYVTVPSSPVLTVPAGPCPHARTFCPGSTAVPSGTGSWMVALTFCAFALVRLHM